MVRCYLFCSFRVMFFFWEPFRLCLIPGGYLCANTKDAINSCKVFQLFLSTSHQKKKIFTTLSHFVASCVLLFTFNLYFLLCLVFLFFLFISKYLLVYDVLMSKRNSITISHIVLQGPGTWWWTNDSFQLCLREESFRYAS